VELTKREFLEKKVLGSCARRLPGLFFSQPEKAADVVGSDETERREKEIFEKGGESSRNGGIGPGFRAQP